MTTRHRLDGHCSGHRSSIPGDYGCNDRAVYRIGIPDMPDEWRESCAQHAAQVCLDRIAVISATGSVVVMLVDHARGGPLRPVRQIPTLLPGRQGDGTADVSDWCRAPSTRGGLPCGYRSKFIVGVPGSPAAWKESCTQHLSKVVDERVAAVSATRSVVVAAVYPTAHSPHENDTGG